jgi:hypothetical protein
MPVLYRHLKSHQRCAAREPAFNLNFPDGTRKTMAFGDRRSDPIMPFRNVAKMVALMDDRNRVFTVRITRFGHEL